MGGSQTVLVLGIACGVVGILGGLVGCYFSIRNTGGVRERAFMVKVSLAMVAVVSGCLALGWALRPGYSFVGLLPLLVLGPAIAWVNRNQARIRREEAGIDRSFAPPGA
ncbi:MAG: hypothetical protein U0800_13350 [Isosphaeraceae bacterium]